MNTNTLYLHNSDEWETPQDLFDDYDAMFDFDLDVCATPENAKCEKFFTKEDDGLTKKWGGCMVQSALLSSRKVGATSLRGGY